MEKIIKVATRLPESVHKQVAEIAKKQNRTPHGQRLAFIIEGVKNSKK